MDSASNARDTTSRRRNSPSPGLSDQERRQAETVAQQLTAKKAVRQQVMRDQDRERAMLKGVVFRAGVEQALQQQRMLADAEQKQAAAEELARLAGVYERRLGKMGEAHLEAASYMQQQREARAAQERRQAELDEVQAQRFQSAIASVKSQHDAARLQVQQQQQRRAQILKAERDKAQAFSAEQAERDKAQKRRQDEQLRLEQERRRRAANGLSVDFRNTRLHEGLGAPGPMPVPAVPAPPIPAVPNPTLSAEELEQKAELERRRKEMAALEAEHRARERFLAAQAKLRADAQRKQVEAELAELTAQRAAAKKQALDAHRLRLQDQRKQQELLRVFEENFLQQGAHDDDLAPRTLPSHLRPAPQPPAAPAKGEIAVQTDPEPPSADTQVPASSEPSPAPEPAPQTDGGSEPQPAGEQQAASNAGGTVAGDEQGHNAATAAAAPVDAAGPAAMEDDDALDDWAEEEVDRELARMRKELGLEDSDMRSSATSLTSSVSVPALLGDAAERRATSQLLREAADTAAAAAASLAGTGSAGAAAAAAAAAARARAAAEMAARAAAAATAETAAAVAAAAAAEETDKLERGSGTPGPSGKQGVAAGSVAASSPADTLSSSVLRLLNTPTSVSESPATAAGAPAGAATAVAARAAARAGTAVGAGAMGKAAGASSRGLFAGLSPGSLPSDLDDVLLLSDLDWEELEGMAGLRPAGGADAAASGATRAPGAGAAADRGLVASASSSPSLSAVGDAASIQRLVAEGILPPDIGALLASPGGLTSTLTATTDLSMLPPAAGHALQEQQLAAAAADARSTLSSSVSGLSAILAAAPSAATAAAAPSDTASVLSLGSLSAASSLSSLSAYAAGLAAASAAAGRRGTGAAGHAGYGLAPIPEEVPGAPSAAPSAPSSITSLPGGAAASGAGGAAAAAATSTPGLSQPVRLTLADLNRELMSSAAAWKGRLEAGSGPAAGAAAAAAATVAAAAASSAPSSSLTSLAARTGLAGRPGAHYTGSGATPGRPTRPGPMMIITSLEPSSLGAPLQPPGLFHGAASASTLSSPLSLPLAAQQRPADGVAAAAGRAAAVSHVPQTAQPLMHPGTPSSSLSSIGLPGTGVAAFGAGSVAAAVTSSAPPVMPEASTPGPAPSSSTSSLLATPATTVTAGAGRVASGARGRNQVSNELSSPYEMYDKESRRLAELMSSITASLQQSAQAVARAGGGGGAALGGGTSVHASPSAAAAAALAVANAERLLGELPTPSSVSSLSSATFSEALAVALAGSRRSPAAARAAALAAGAVAASGVGAGGGAGSGAGSGSNRSTPTRSAVRPSSAPTASPTRGLDGPGSGVGRPSPSASPQQQTRIAVSARSRAGLSAGTAVAAALSSPTTTTLSSISSLLHATAALPRLAAQPAAGPPVTASTSSLSSGVSSLQPLLNASASGGRGSGVDRAGVGAVARSPPKAAWQEQTAQPQDRAQAIRGRAASVTSPTRTAKPSRSPRLASGAAALSPGSPAAGAATAAAMGQASPGPSLPSPGTPPSPAFTDSTLSTQGASPAAAPLTELQRPSAAADASTTLSGVPGQPAQAGDAVATVAGAIADLLRRRAAGSAAATTAAAPPQQAHLPTAEVPESPAARAAGHDRTRVSPAAGVWASLTGQSLEDALAGLMEGAESSLDDLLRSSLNLSASVSLAELVPPSQEPSTAALPLQQQPAAQSPAPGPSEHSTAGAEPHGEPLPLSPEPTAVTDEAQAPVSGAGAAASGDAGEGDSERPELSVSASAGSDDFGNIMAGLLQDIQRGLAVMGAAVAQPLPTGAAPATDAALDEEPADRAEVADQGGEDAAWWQEQEEQGLPRLRTGASAETVEAASGKDDEGEEGLRTESEEELGQFHNEAVAPSLSSQLPLPEHYQQLPQLPSPTARVQREDSAGGTAGSSAGAGQQPEFLSMPTFSRGFAEGSLRRSPSLPSPASPQSPRDGDPGVWFGGAGQPVGAAAGSVTGLLLSSLLTGGASRLMSAASAPPPRSSAAAATSTTPSGAYSFLQPPRASATRGRTPSSVKSGGDSPSPPGSPLPPFSSAGVGSLGANASIGGAGSDPAQGGGATGAPAVESAAVAGDGNGSGGSQHSSPIHSVTTVSSLNSLTDALAAYPLFGGIHHSPLGSPSSSEEGPDGAAGVAPGADASKQVSVGAASASSGGARASLANWSPLPIQYESLQPTAPAGLSSPQDTEPWRGAWDLLGLSLGGRRASQDAGGPWLWQDSGRAGGAAAAAAAAVGVADAASRPGGDVSHSPRQLEQQQQQQAAQVHTPLAQRRSSSGLQGLHLDIPESEVALQSAGVAIAAVSGGPGSPPLAMATSGAGVPAASPEQAASRSAATTPTQMREAAPHYHQHQPAALTAAAGGSHSGSPPLHPWPQHHQPRHGAVDGGSPLRSPGGGWRRRVGGATGQAVGLSEEQLTGLLMWTVSDFFSSPSNSSSSGGSAGEY
ncbi:hypothetical protein HYH02_008027 [Chlamydomonas schloesseri]|uniref:Uncharacterized protein n=1 Tax=Chlamydomonas schloesseri TaxID=2026947 RepID=A0A836B3T7_9CHLO|nr:hypothetical protein HYH02_008027 [Chlamydomonas schloesseri]|eukprot:KAG2446870.1 hypothetical protein HYH02_008027 [Chlamydomonas schloesseri]